jgi:protein TonB
VISFIARSGALGASVLVHAGLFAAVAGVRMPTLAEVRSGPQITLVEIVDDAPAEAPAPHATPLPEPIAEVPKPARSRKLAPTRSAPAPTVAAAVSSQSPAAAPANVPRTAAEPEPQQPKFSLPSSRELFASVTARVASRPEAVARPEGQAEPAALRVLAEREVSTPARLVAAVEVAYPAEARAAEIEADVPVEIVVDKSGRVADARAVTHSGYGLDDAALRAVRNYRFSPALREGEQVAVRMRWRVSFRLR